MRRALVTLPFLLFALFQAGCLFSGGVGVTTTVTKREVAVGPTLDVASNVYTKGSNAPVRIPNSELAAGPRLELGALFPVRRFDARQSKTPALLVATGANIAPTTLSNVSAGLVPSVTLGHWRDPLSRRRDLGRRRSHRVW